MEQRRRVRWGRLIALCTVFALLGIGPVPAADAEPVLPDPPASLGVSQRATIAILYWPSVDGAEGYAVDYGTDSTFVAATRVTTTAPFTVLSALTPATSYYARVASWAPDTGAVGTWGSPTTFTTSEPSYALPAPVVSLKSSTSTSITATWARVTSSATYETRIGKKADALSYAESVDGRRTTFTKLARATEYYISVRAVDASGAALTAWSDPVAYSTPKDLPLRVGSYNIHNSTKSKGHSWSSRRTAVASTILGQDADVVGLQEAGAKVPGRGTRQYKDLLNLLGANWRVTTTAQRNGPMGDRIIYDSSKVVLLSQGYQRLAGSNRFGDWRFVVWATFRQKSTGKKFFFVDTHLVPFRSKARYLARKQEARQLVSIVKARNSANLPTIIVGDFNSTKFRKPDNAPFKVITGAGYIDPLDNIDGWRGGPRGIAESRIRANLFTANQWRLHAPRGRYSTGLMLDQIFVTPMRVSEWETVAKLDSSGRFIGTIPSDHNMIRATVHLP